MKKKLTIFKGHSCLDTVFNICVQYICYWKQIRKAPLQFFMQHLIYDCLEGVPPLWYGPKVAHIHTSLPQVFHIFKETYEVFTFHRPLLQLVVTICALSDVIKQLKYLLLHI